MSRFIHIDYDRNGPPLSCTVLKVNWAWKHCMIVVIPGDKIEDGPLFLPNVFFSETDIK